jgi:hypothetical protein
VRKIYNVSIEPPLEVHLTIDFRVLLKVLFSGDFHCIRRDRALSNLSWRGVMQKMGGEVLEKTGIQYFMQGNNWGKKKDKF